MHFKLFYPFFFYPFSPAAEFIQDSCVNSIDIDEIGSHQDLHCLSVFFIDSGLKILLYVQKRMFPKGLKGWKKVTEFEN